MRFALKLVGLPLLGCAFAYGQTITGTITGVVTDASGAVIPGAQITVRNQDTNTITTAVSLGSGNYTVPLLPPGTYTVAVKAAGFGAFSTANLTLTADQTAKADVRLKPGETNTEVKVEADAVQLQTEAGDLNAVLSAKEIETLPNISHNPLQYAQTVPGVQPRGNFGNPHPTNTTAPGRTAFRNFSVNGSRSLSSEILLDGAPDTTQSFNEIAFLPPLDSLQEFKLITSGYSAEFGRVGGGVVQLITKAGTNQYHGVAYDYSRNSAFNSNSYGNKYQPRNADGSLPPNAKKAYLNAHQFGGNFGGPVRIPHLYNGTDKTFFFFSYEGQRRVDGVNGTITVPTALERVGDFSKSLQVNAASLPVNIYHPSPETTTVTTPLPGQYQLNRAQFSDGGVFNKIPASRLDQTALKYLAFYPLPNITPLNPNDGSNNFFYNDPNRTRVDQIILRVDENVSEKQRFFIRATGDSDSFHQSNPLISTNPGAGQLPPFATSTYTGTAGYTLTLNAKSLLDLRLSALRLNLSQLPQGGGPDLGALGYAPALAALSPHDSLPRIFFQGPTKFYGLGVASFNLLNNHSTIPSFTASYTHLFSRQTLKVGGEYRVYFSNYFQPFIPDLGFAPQANGNYSKRCDGQGCPTLSPSDSGFALAEVAIGAMDTDQRFSGGQISSGEPALAGSLKYAGIYVQDDVKVTPSLTVNAGLRWELQVPLTERHNRLSQFNLNANNLTGTPGVYEFSGVGGNGRPQTNTEYKNFAPRFGFAFQATPSTVIHGAYALSYEPVTGQGSGAQGFGTDGFGKVAFSSIRPTTGALAGQDIQTSTFENPGFIGGGVALGSDPANAARYLGTNVNAIIRRQRTPYIQQYNLTVERQLPFGIDMQLTYVGSKGTFENINALQFNVDSAINPGKLAAARSAFTATGVNPELSQVTNPYFGIIPVGGIGSITSRTVTQRQLDLPFPAYGNVQALSYRGNSTNYNSGVVYLRRAFQSGAQLGGYYVFSKSIDFASSFGSLQGGTGNNNNGGGGDIYPTQLELERSVSNGDIPHRGVIFETIDLPIGKGHRFFANVPVLNQVLTGFKVAGITTFQSGLPQQITGGSGFGRPNLVQDPRLPGKLNGVVGGYNGTPVTLPDGRSFVVQKGRKLVFNPDAFQNPVVTTPKGPLGDIYYRGSTPRFLSYLRGFGTDNTDLTLSRTFPIHERLNLEMQLQAQNVFNRASFSDGGYDRNLGAGNLNSSSTLNPALGSSTDPNFGTSDINTTLITPRYLQIAARLSF